MRFKLGALSTIATMICGDEPFGKFMPYRSSSKLTAFFQNLNLDYRHDGSTRRTWVEDVLKELNQIGDIDSPYPSDELLSVIKSIVDEDYFENEYHDRRQAWERLNQLLVKYNLRLEESPWGIDVATIKGTSNDDPFAILSPRPSIADVEVASTITKKTVSDVKRVEEESIVASRVNQPQVTKIFISHSSKDAKFASELLDLLERIGVDGESIFCTSVPGHGIPLGNNFLERIKAEITSDVLVLFVLSHNFYDSAVSLCEMGATWVQSKHHIPIVVPPFDFIDIKGVIPLTQGIRINEPHHLTQLYETVCVMFALRELKFQTWERHRDRFIQNVNQLMTM